MKFSFQLSKAERLLFDKISGCFNSAIQINKSLSKGYELQTTKFVPAASVLVEVPFTIWEEYSYDFAAREISIIYQDFWPKFNSLTYELNFSSKNSKDLLKPLSLAYSIVKRIDLDVPLNSQSVYLDFLLQASFPNNSTALPHILLLDDESIACLEGSQSYHSILKRKLFYSKISKILFPNTVEKDLFLWAIGIILSRGFSDDKISLTLIPGIDLVNHSSTPNAEHSYNEVNKKFLLTAIQDIQPGSEVLISYGKGRDNTSMLALYGFVDRENPNDTLIINMKGTNTLLKVNTQNDVVISTNNNSSAHSSVSNNNNFNVSLLEAWKSHYNPNNSNSTGNISLHMLTITELHKIWTTDLKELSNYLVSIEDIPSWKKRSHNDDYYHHEQKKEVNYYMLVAEKYCEIIQTKLSSLLHEARYHSICQFPEQLYSILQSNQLSNSNIESVRSITSTNFEDISPKLLQSFLLSCDPSHPLTLTNERTAIQLLIQFIESKLLTLNSHNNNKKEGEEDNNDRKEDANSSMYMHWRAQFSWIKNKERNSWEELKDILKVYSLLLDFLN